MFIITEYAALMKVESIAPALSDNRSKKTIFVFKRVAVLDSFDCNLTKETNESSSLEYQLRNINKNAQDRCRF